MKYINSYEIIEGLTKDNMYMMESVCNLVNNSQSESFILNEIRCMVKEYETRKLEIEFLKIFDCTFSHLKLPEEFDYIDLICYYTYNDDAIKFLKEHKNKESDIIGLFTYYINMMKEADSND